MGWNPISWQALPEQPPLTPKLAGLVYPGARHILSGPPESAKTWIAFALALEEIRAGGVVLHLDFEMNAWQTRDRLRLMGATLEELDQFLYVAPEDMATDDEIADLIQHEKVTLATIDAVAGAYRLQGLDDNARKDAEHFYATMVNPFWRRNVGTLILDHVAKNEDSRGAFTIGSERKVGSADVHLGASTITPFGRGRIGCFKLITHKDRFGCLPRPKAAEIELRSDRISNAVTWQIKRADGDEEWAGPTNLMEKVSRFLEDQNEAVSRTRVEKSVSGNAAYVREAMDTLVANGYASQTPGPNRAHLLKTVTPYRSPNGLSSPSATRTDLTHSTVGHANKSVPTDSAQPSQNGGPSQSVPGTSGRTEPSPSRVPLSKEGTHRTDTNTDELSRYGVMTYAQLQTELGQP